MTGSCRAASEKQRSSYGVKAGTNSFVFRRLDVLDPAVVRLYEDDTVIYVVP